jgi:Fe-S cluster assembly protein SufD
MISSTGVFSGRIMVQPDAQKDECLSIQQEHHLLSDNATINTKPQLEIFADDVKCSHGCTVGQLDEEALFYLRARGIPKGSGRGIAYYWRLMRLTSWFRLNRCPLRNHVAELIYEHLSIVIK